ncbi:MAG: hypothetical protein NTZ26_15610 [Candidatus Aminicenantes bacterium]|nr:hypothetical protein [Candidatus Aminicenantes bacterium]
MSFTRLIVPYPDRETASAALAFLRANLDSYIKVTSDRADGFDFADFQSQAGKVRKEAGVLDIRFKLKAGLPVGGTIPAGD